MTNSFIILNKPSGPTSNDCLRQLKKCFPRGTKMGFCGTLDPFAEGVLPVAIEEATKAIPYLLDTQKTYHFTIQWGIQTDSDDREGKIEKTTSMIPSSQAVEAILPSFLGEQLQTPPIFSAKKIAGKRAYDLARQGEEIILAPCPIHIYNLQILQPLDKYHTTFTVTCSKGTYVRRLARDIAHCLDSYGHVTRLIRTQVGPFSLDQALDLELFLSKPKLCKEKLVSIAEALTHLPHYTLAEKETKALQQGQQIDLTALKLSYQPKETYQEVKDVILCIDCAKKPIGLAKIVKKSVQPIRIFHIM